MDVTFKSQEGCRKTYAVTAPWSEIEPHFQEVTKTLRSRVRLPGFRPGKAPDSMVRTRFKKEIREEVLEHLLPEAAKSMLSSFDIKPVVEPYADAIELKEGEPFSCELNAEVAPEVPEVSAEGIEIESPSAEVDDKRVDDVLESLRQRGAVMKPLEEPASEGDYAVVSMTRKGQSKAQEQFLGALSGSDHPAEKALVGKNVGDEFELTVDGTPAEEGETKDETGKGFSHAHLAPGEYHFKVDKVVRREVPDLNDDFAKDLGTDDLETLKAKVRQDIEVRVAQEVRAIQEDRLIEALLEKYEIDAPATLVERQLREDIEEIAADMAKQGVDLNNPNINWEEVAKARRVVAARKVAAYYLLGEVARRAGIEAAEEDVSAYFEVRARETGASAEKLKAGYRKEGRMESVKTLIVHKKAVDLLLSQASVKLTEGKSDKQEDVNAPDSDSSGADEPR